MHLINNPYIYDLYYNQAQKSTDVGCHTNIGRKFIREYQMQGGCSINTNETYQTNGTNFVK